MRRLYMIPTTEEVQRIAQQILDRQGFIILPCNQECWPGRVVESVQASTGPLGDLVITEEATRQDYDSQIALAREIIGPQYRRPLLPKGAYFYRTIAE